MRTHFFGSSIAVMMWYERIRQARLAMPHMSQKALAELVGVSQPLIAKIESGKIEKTDSLPKIVEVLGLDLSDFSENLYKIYGNKGAVSSELHNFNDPSVWASKSGSPSELPLYAPIELDGGRFGIDPKPIGSLRRPPILSGVTDAYAIFVINRNMTPEFDPGDKIIINPRLPVLGDNSCVFLNFNGDAPIGCVCRYLNSDDLNWQVSQHNPPTKHMLPRADWPIRHRIVFKILK